MRGRKARVQPTERTTVGYVRVSTLDQAENGVSLDAQESRIAAYATALGWQVSEIIRDAGESAKSLKRPGIAKVLSGVQAGAIGRVITLKLDRVTRSMRDLSSLLDVFAKADASLVSVSESLDTQSAAGRLVVNMLGVVAEWERLAIGERTAQALAQARSMHAAGASLRQNAARLDSLGVKPNNGGSKWYAQSVKHILTSKMTSEAA